MANKQTFFCYFHRQNWCDTQTEKKDRKKNKWHNSHITSGQINDTKSLLLIGLSHFQSTIYIFYCAIRLRQHSCCFVNCFVFVCFKANRLQRREMTLTTEWKAKKCANSCACLMKKRIEMYCHRLFDPYAGLI